MSSIPKKSNESPTTARHTRPQQLSQNQNLDEEQEELRESRKPALFELWRLIPTRGEGARKQEYVAEAERKKIYNAVFSLVGDRQARWRSVLREKGYPWDSHIRTTNEGRVWCGTLAQLAVFWQITLDDLDREVFKKEGESCERKSELRYYLEEVFEEAEKLEWSSRC